MKEFTHTAIECGNDNRVPASYRRLVELRETKLYWISKNGKKYRKRTGNVLGDWPTFRIDLSTVKEIK